MNVFAFLNIDLPWIAWLVYRGEMVSPNASGQQVLSIWHARYLIDAGQAHERYDYYRRELEIERVRQALFRRSVSRLSGLYFFQDAESARRAGRRWDGHFREAHLAEIEISEWSGVSRYDSDWITEHMGSLDSSWIPNYLRGEPLSEKPLWELLVEGKGRVLGTQLRKDAYETVKRTWPRSLALLELSRVAVELNSDLGLIWPILTTEGRTRSLRLYLDFRDAENPEFLERLGKYKGPKNTADLNAMADLVTPELSDFFVQFSL